MHKGLTHVADLPDITHVADLPDIRRKHGRGNSYEEQKSEKYNKGVHMNMHTSKTYTSHVTRQLISKVWDRARLKINLANI